MLQMRVDNVARVKQAIAEVGYQPNLVASSLWFEYTNAIGLLLSNVANHWFAELDMALQLFI
jgi:DNA-binding LacI/PurR family transcriptional regulator